MKRLHARWIAARPVITAAAISLLTLLIAACGKGGSGY